MWLMTLPGHRCATAQRCQWFVWRRANEQTADEFEIEDGLDEGIEIYNRLAPMEVVRNERGSCRA